MTGQGKLELKLVSISAEVFIKKKKKKIMISNFLSFFLET